MLHSSKKREPAPQSFDPESFSIHGVEHSIRERIWPLQRKESLVKVRDDLKVFRGETVHHQTKPKKSVIVSLVANVLLPGLGNSYAHANAFSVSILILSLFVLFTTFSPVFPIVGLLGLGPGAQPYNAVEQPTLFVPSSIQLPDQSIIVGPTFSILIVPLLLAWIHLLFLFLNHDKIDWVA